MVAGRAGGGAGTDFALARLNSDGTPDTSFSGDGKLTYDATEYDDVSTVALAPGGKIVGGASVSLKLKLPARVLSKALKALAGGKKATAPFKVSALDAGGKALGFTTGTVKFRVKFIR